MLAHLIEDALMAARPGRSTRKLSGAILGTTAALSAMVAGAVVLSRSVHRVKVEGGSMAPALLPGDCLVVVRPAHRGLPLFSAKEPWLKPGEVVAVRDPRHPGRILVKRVARVDGDGASLEVLGDASHASTDSRTFGPVPMSSVLGRAVYRYAPPGRTGGGPWVAGYDRG
jgi:nickel-type superoxide dismutase maturation protease